MHGRTKVSLPPDIRERAANCRKTRRKTEIPMQLRNKICRCGRGVGRNACFTKYNVFVEKSPNRGTTHHFLPNSSCGFRTLAGGSKTYFCARNTGFSSNQRTAVRSQIPGGVISSHFDLSSFARLRAIHRNARANSRFRASSSATTSSECSRTRIEGQIVLNARCTSGLLFAPQLPIVEYPRDKVGVVYRRVNIRLEIRKNKNGRR